MRLPWHPTARTGIDLGSRWVKAVELGADGRVSRSARLPRGSGGLDAIEIGRVCEILRRQGFGLRSVALLAPHQSLRRQVVRLPDKPDAARDGAIVQNHFAELPDGASGSCAWWELPRGSRGSDAREALAYATGAAEADVWVRGFEAQGVTVRGIDTPSSAVTRGVGGADAVVADLGWSRLGLTLCVGGLPVYERSDTGCGIGALVHAEAERTGRTAEQIESLIREETSGLGLPGLPGGPGWMKSVSDGITATAEYAMRRYGLRASPQVFIVGGGATAEVVETLAGSLGAACRVGLADEDPDRAAARVTAGRWAA